MKETSTQNESGDGGYDPFPNLSSHGATHFILVT